ncbi:bacterial proteasome activator family protein [Propionibacteriaceae bacterium Y2011]|uniref:bacterial proteasome activator family protein n=1 Tax=Microlunatus sp. Y2014 TaxID=3418488 RepID=UPI003B471FC5
MSERTGGSAAEGAEQGAPAVTARTEDGRVILVTPSGMAVEGPPETQEQDAATPEGGSDDDRAALADMVSQPDKVMRIGTMTRTLLAELKEAPLDEQSRQRLRDIHRTSIAELKEGVSPELAEELGRLAQPFESDTPSEPELRIAQAQLVGWLEGLFQGIQTALFAQQMASRAQLEQMRRALPQGPPAPGQAPGDEGPGRSGMYL